MITLPKNKNMKNILFTLLFVIAGFNTIQASFPVTENNTSEMVYSEEDPDVPISKSEKVFWFILGLLGSYVGVIIAIIYQLITKKKGIIKQALFGFLTLIVLAILFLIVLLGELGDLDFGEIFFLG